MTFGKGIAPVHAMAELKQTVQPNHQTGPTLHISFLYSQNDHHFRDPIISDYVSFPLHLQKI